MGALRKSLTDWVASAAAFCAPLATACTREAAEALCCGRGWEALGGSAGRAVASSKLRYPAVTAAISLREGVA